jgi:hypothetical protein
VAEPTTTLPQLPDPEPDFNVFAPEPNCETVADADLSLDI